MLVFQIKIDPLNNFKLSREHTISLACTMGVKCVDLYPLSLFLSYWAWWCIDDVKPKKHDTGGDISAVFISSGSSPFNRCSWWGGLRVLGEYKWESCHTSDKCVSQWNRKQGAASLPSFWSNCRLPQIFASLESEPYHVPSSAFLHLHLEDTCIYTYVCLNNIIQCLAKDWFMLNLTLQELDDQAPYNLPNVIKCLLNTDSLINYCQPLINVNTTSGRE